jgi:LPS export ABC transporter protein LptC
MINPQARSWRLVVYACCAYLLWAACVNDEEQVREMFEKRIGVDEALGVESYMSQGGKMKARLKAPLMLRYQDTLPRVEFPNTLHVDFFDDSLRTQSQLDARYAQYVETQNKIFLRDSVRVFNTRGDTLFCQELWWDQNEQRFYTDKPVRIHQPGTIINGVGLTAPQDFKTFTMYRITNSVLRVSEGVSTQTDSTAAPADSSARRFTRPGPTVQ